MIYTTQPQFFNALRLFGPLALTVLCACNKTPTKAAGKAAPEVPTVRAGTDPLPFVGRWTRTFKAGADAEQKATYNISPTQIHYSLTGPLTSADYVVHKDWYSKDQGRIVGHGDDGTHYVILIRDISDSKLTLYKQPVDDIAAGKRLPIPAVNTQEHHGWNTYQKKTAQP